MVFTLQQRLAVFQAQAKTRMIYHLAITHCSGFVRGIQTL